MRVCPADCERYSQCFAVVSNDIFDALHVGVFAEIILSIMTCVWCGLWIWQKMINFFNKNDIK